jgi:hypothetical protein
LHQEKEEEAGIMGGYTANQIAQVCHEANRAFQCVIGEIPSPAWYSDTDEMRFATIESVDAVTAGATAAELHETWRQSHLATGWTHGPVKDYERKTHPLLVPYNDLPAAQKDKDVLFRAVVLALTIADE